MVSRRSLLALAAGSLAAPRARSAAKSKLKIGLLLPFSGTYAALGVNIAGAQAVTGTLCAPNVFRTSFSNWQTSYPCAEVMLKAGHKKAVLMFWNYAFGQESMSAFKEGYSKGGGTIVKEIPVPFPTTEFQANLSEIASLKPDAVFVFFAGAGAAKFVKDYADAGLRTASPSTVPASSPQASSLRRGPPAGAFSAR